MTDKRIRMNKAISQIKGAFHFNKRVVENKKGNRTPESIAHAEKQNLEIVKHLETIAKQTLKNRKR